MFSVSTAFSSCTEVLVPMAKTQGLGKVHVITGPGKGKTTAAFGLAMRASGQGLRTTIVQFMKCGETTGEVIAAKRLKGLDVHQFGTGRFVDPKNPSKDDRKCAHDALEFARSVLEKGKCDLMILDEVSLAASLGLIDPAEVLEMLKSRANEIEIVLTGRNAPIEFIEYADYVSLIESKKHPYDRGLKARKGIEW